MPVDDRMNDLGARLEALVAEGASRANPPPPATIRRRSRRRRAVITMTVAIAVACAAAVLRASWPEPASTTVPLGPLPGERVVPWIPAPATSNPADQGPPTVPPGTPACTNRQLQASVGWEGATGSVAGGATFTNRGPAPCLLVGYPTIELLDAHGRALPLASSLFGGSTADPAPRPVLLRSDSGALVEFHWMNWCGQDPGPLSVRITLPHGGAVVPTVEARTPRLTPRCDVPGSSLLTRGPFVAVGSPAPSDPRSVLDVQVALPDRVMVGQRLHYTVTLANPTDTTLSLRECPSYEERVSLENGGTASEHHLLNCHPVGAIGAGQKVTFEMVMDVPATLGPGNGVLMWELLPHGPPATKVPITLIPGGGTLEPAPASSEVS